MHIEFLVEDSSGTALIKQLLPKLLGEDHTWRVHGYKGVGRIPVRLKSHSDASKKTLLDNLGALLRGLCKTTGIDAVVVVVDSDRRDCKAFLQELHQLRDRVGATSKPVLFRMAIEEIEAWYLGDQAALLQAYPHAKADVLHRYKQDSICETWEVLADAVYPGGRKALKDAGWPLPGQVKCQWAEQIGPLLDPDRNVSRSFQKLCSGLRRLIAENQTNKQSL